MTTLPGPALESVLWKLLPEVVMTQDWLQRPPRDPAPGRTNPRCAALAVVKPQRQQVLTLSLVCRAWRDVINQVIESKCQWWARIEHLPSEEQLLARLPGKRVAVLEVWAEDSTATNAVLRLLCHPGFIAGASSTLVQVTGLPQQCARSLPSFPHIHTLHIYDTGSLEQQAAAVDLAPLHRLPQLADLTIDWGIMALADVPRGLASLTLVDADRLLLPPVQGHTVVDRLLSQLEYIGE